MLPRIYDVINNMIFNARNPKITINNCFGEHIIYYECQADKV